MKTAAWIDVACNDPDNGVFDGKTHAITYRLWDGEYCELEADNWDGYAFTELAGAIRIHRKAFGILEGKDWVGNWCWNGYKLNRSEAKRLLGTLRNSGRWRCTHGPCRWFDWFNKPVEAIEAARLEHTQRKGDDGRHPFVPDERWPLYCKTCGHGRDVFSKHIPEKLAVPE